MNTPRMRWIAYGLAAVATLGAIVAGEAPQQEHLAVVEPVRREPGTPAAPPAARGEVQVRLDLLRRGPGTELPRSDPFSLPAPPAPPQPAVQAPPAPPPRPQAPALPFTYMGKWTENGKTIVYLARGDSHVAVKGPGRLDDSYSVESVDERQVVLTYQPLGVRQVLPLLAGAAPSATLSAGAAAPSETESSEETN
jgi:hypothetical protein